MSGKIRTIHLYEVKQRGAGQEVVEIAPGFWERAHSRLNALTLEHRRLIYRGRKYSGRAGSHQNSGRDYIYISKARPGADWPDTESELGDTNRLTLPDDQSLVEPLYLLPLEGTNVVAALRTSGGPTPQALEAWLEMLYKDELEDDVLSIIPVLSRDQRERFASATGATKVHLKLKSGAHYASDEASGIEGAARAIEEETEGDAAVEIGVSYGNKKPTLLQARKMLSLVTGALNRVDDASALEATIIRSDAEGNELKDTIDFLKERVRYRERIGQTEDVPPTEAEIIYGLASALQKYKANTLPSPSDEIE